MGQICEKLGWSRRHSSAQNESQHCSTPEHNLEQKDEGVCRPKLEALFEVKSIATTSAMCFEEGRANKRITKAFTNSARVMVQGMIFPTA
jgi:hypothetical protein